MLTIDRRVFQKDISFRTFSFVLTLSVLISVKGLSAGQLNGTVYSELHQPVPGAVVQLYDAATQVFFKSSVCDNYGNYLIDSIMGGMFSVKIKSDSFPFQWYAPNGNTLYPRTNITINSFGSNSIEITLNKYPVDNLPASQLNLQIKDSLGNPFPGFNGFVQLYDNSGFQVQSTNINAVGIATFNSLQPGSYSINISASPFPPQYYNPGWNSNFAVYLLPIAKNDTQNVPVVLTMSPGGRGHIYGRVFLETGLPAPMVHVELFTGTDLTAFKTMQYTDATGAFAFTGIPEQRYFLKFSAPPNPDQWCSIPLNMTTLRPLDDVPASAISTDTIKVRLLSKPAGGAKLRVSLKDIAGNPVFGKVSIVNLNNIEQLMTYDSPVNLYKIDSVTPANYSLKFDIPGYDIQYFGQSGNTPTPVFHFSIDTVDLQFNAILKKTYGPISGFIKDSVQPVANAVVRIYTFKGNLVSMSSTDPTGRILPLKGYIDTACYMSVEAAGYPKQYYTQSGPVLDSLVAYRFYCSATDTTRINFSISKFAPPPKKTARLAVNLKDESGNPAIGKVSIVDINNVEKLMPYDSPVNLYKIDSVSPGRYSLKFDIPGYSIQYYGQSGNTQTPVFYFNTDTVDLQVNAIIKKYGIISGFIKDSAQPVANAVVRIYNYKGIFVNASSTDPAGRILPLKGYIDTACYLSVEAAGYPKQYYTQNGPVLDSSSAYRFTCSATDTTRINFSISKFTPPPKKSACITVTLKDETGKPAVGNVWLFNTAGIYKPIVYDSINKIYKTDSVSAGSYTLRFYVSGYDLQYYGQSGNTLTPAFYFSVDTTDLLINSTLKKFAVPVTDGLISGFIKDSMLPVAGATVRVYSNKGNLVSETRTDSSGKISPLKGYIDTACYLSVEATGYPVQYYTQSGPVLDPNAAYRFNCIANDTIKILFAINKFAPVQKKTIKITVNLKNESGMTVAGKVSILNTSGNDKQMTYDSLMKIYRIDSISPGNYTFRFDVPGYDLQYYGQSGNTLTASSYFSVDTTDLQFNSTLKKFTIPVTYGLISGIIKDSVQPVAGAAVRVYSYKGLLVSESRTDSSGRFSPLKGYVDTACYLSVEATGYPVQYYTQNGPALDPNAAYRFNCMANDTIKINFSINKFTPVFKKTVVVSVNLQDEFGKPAAGKVNLLDTSGFARTVVYDSVTRIYRADSVVKGKYTLKFDVPGYDTQYYGQPANTQKSSFYFSVDTVDLKLIATLKRFSVPVTYGVITGIVKDSILPVTGAMVRVYSNKGIFVSETRTDSLGRYFLQNVYTDTAGYLSVEATGYPVQYYSQNGPVLDPNAATRITCTPSDTIRINFVISRFGLVINQFNSIKGSVKTDGGKSVANAKVLLADTIAFVTNHVYNPQWINSKYSTYTDNNGLFSFNNIVPGKYFAIAQAESLNYVLQFYNQKDDPESAEKIKIDSASVLDLGFTLRIGCKLNGSAIDSKGSPLRDVYIGLQQAGGDKAYQTTTDSNGAYQLNGLSSGKYSVWVSKYDFLNINPGPKDLQVVENQTITIPPIILDKGGRIKGAVSIKDTFLYTTGNYLGGNISLFADSLFSGNQKYLWPSNVSGVQILIPAGLTSGQFISDPISAGKYRMIFSPCDNCYASGNSTPDTVIQDTLKFKAGLGWSYIGQDTAIQYLPFYNIISGDTVFNSSITLRKGYSVFGKVKTANGAQIKSDYNVSAFVKQGSGVLVCVSQCRILNDGRFELSGLINNENYYIHVFAPGYTGQFWSPFDGNTAMASTAYHFSTSSFVPLDVSISSSPAGNFGSGNKGPITLWKDPDSSSVVLRWIKDDSTAIDTFKIYATDLNGTMLLKSIPSGPASLYSYKDMRNLTGWQNYRVAGIGTNSIVRSTSVYYEPRDKSTPSGRLWINAYGNRSGVNIEWGTSSDVNLTQADSVNLYKKKSGGVWTRILRQSAYNRMLGDYSWNKSDSGSTCYYKVEIDSRNLVSTDQMFVFDSKFFAGLSPVITVGPFEKYKTIQSAIDAATNYTTIRVRAGTYYENLNFKGKALSINGDWEFGKPPVLDGNGGLAVTIPYFPQTENYSMTSINGFKIRNASTGIKTSSPVNINQDLFVNVIKAIDIQVDSVSMLNALILNPVLSNRIDVNVWQCTFISKISGNNVASVSSRGIAESPSYSGNLNGSGDYYIKPVVSYYSNLGINNSILAYYYSTGKQSNIPITATGASTRVFISNCDLWQTQSIASTQTIMKDSNQLNTDPIFIDTVSYFVSAASALTKSKTGIGYDSRYSTGYQNQKTQPSVVKNLIVRSTGMKSVFLRWDPAPQNEKIVSYRIYRGPGDTSLFYVDPNSQWQLKLSEDSMFTVIDTFSTSKQWFLDTSIKIGKPYLYVVSAVDSSGTEGKVDLSAQRPITSYFVNIFNYDFKVSAQKWYMMSPWGTDNLSIVSTDSYVYYWDAKKSADKLLGQYSRTNQLNPCQGYWFKPAKDTILTVGTESLTKLYSVQDSLNVKLVSGISGWNQIASPLPFHVSPTWMSSFTVWEWNADSLGYAKADSLKPWQAYWIHTSKDTVLPLIEKTLPVSGGSLAKSKSINSVWDLKVSLTGKNAWDIDNHIGVVPASLAKSTVTLQPEPPLAFGSSQLYFVNNDSESNVATKDKMLSDIYKISNNAIPYEKMEFTAAITPCPSQSTLRVGNLGSLPKETYAYWIDSRGAVDLKEHNEIVVDKHNETVYGLIVITANPADIRIYSSKFALHTPFPNPSRGVSVIEYVLPYNWSSGIPDGVSNVKIQIFDISGRVVRTLAERTETAGVHHVIWDGKNSMAQRITAGVYIIRLESGNNNKSVRVSRF